MGELKRFSEAEADAALASFNITREQVEAGFSQLDSLLGWVQISKEEASSVPFDFNESEVRESIKSFRPQLEAAGVISKSGQSPNEKDRAVDLDGARLGGK